MDAATATYVTSKEWRQVLDSHNILLQTPSCTSSPQFPSTFEFYDRNLTMCYDNEAFDVWPSIYEESGRLIVNIINKQYSLRNFSASFKKIDTTGGYFLSMKKAVDSGVCDMAISATAISSERSSQVHFQCSNGVSFSGILRSELQNDTITIKTVQDLNNEKIIVVVSDGSVFQNYVKKNLPKAIIKSIPGYDEAWQMVLNKTAHAFVADALDIYVWLGEHKNSCSTCSVNVFGDALFFGTFISNLVAQSGGASLIFGSSRMLLVVIIFQFLVKEY